MITISASKPDGTRSRGSMDYLRSLGMLVHRSTGEVVIVQDNFGNPVVVYGYPCSGPEG